MNPLSAFSFGKILKTFIPGLIAAAGSLLLVELAYRVSSGKPCAPGSGFWPCFFSESLLSVALADTARTTAFGALLLPIALMLGFLLNTVMWFCVNDICRRRADRKIDGALREAHATLEGKALEAYRAVLAAPAAAPRVHLSDFYLHLVDLEKLTSLRESYFSWFEFHLNSLGALCLTAAAYTVTVTALGQRWSIAFSWLSHLVVPLAAVLALGMFLWCAGLRNLQRYQEGFVWFLVGTLHVQAQGGNRATPPML